MSAFGKRPGATPAGAGGARPAFGVARPMQGGGAAAAPAQPAGGAQFPPLPEEQPLAFSSGAPQMDAMARLAQREASLDEVPVKVEGFEVAVHRIKEQVLPRLLERIDPEAAATLSKDELAEEFRPIIGEVLAELKLTLNRREQFALEKVLVDELLGLGPLEELLNDPLITDIMVNGPDQTYIEKKGKLTIAPIPVSYTHLRAHETM
jgi:pilus assembly protein CpaF